MGQKIGNEKLLEILTEASAENFSEFIKSFNKRVARRYEIFCRIC